MKMRITVATANTHFGRMVQTPDGMQPVAHADVLLLQEVHNPHKLGLGSHLKTFGFSLVCSAPHFGLAIALRDSSTLRFVPGSAQEHKLANMSKLERTIVKKAIDSAVGFHERGMISCEFQTQNGEHVTIANAHPTTPISMPPGARRQQIAELTRVLVTHYADQPLILAGDMNHYPGPQKIDKKLHVDASLTPVTIGKEPTWYARGSEQELLLKLSALLLRRTLEDFNGQHDIILYRQSSFQEHTLSVTDIASDHRAIVASFTLA